MFEEGMESIELHADSAEASYDLLDYKNWPGFNSDPEPVYALYKIERQLAEGRTGRLAPPEPVEDVEAVAWLAPDIRDGVPADQLVVEELDLSWRSGRLAAAIERWRRAEERAEYRRRGEKPPKAPDPEKRWRLPNEQGGYWEELLEHLHLLKALSGDDPIIAAGKAAKLTKLEQDALFWACSYSLQPWASYLVADKMGITIRTAEKLISDARARVHDWVFANSKLIEAV